METQDLKVLLLKEHARDKKLTIINFALIFALVIVIIGLVLYFSASLAHIFSGATDSMSGEYGWYFQLAIGALLLGAIIYPINKMLKISKRPAKIDELLAKIEKGRRAASVDEYVEHRIIIPLGKITFKLCPVSYTMVNFEGDIHFYKLPLNGAYAPDFRTLLSGVNLGAVNAAKDELYSGVAAPQGKVEAIQDESAATTPIKSVDDFKKYMNEELSETINELENSRKGGRKTMLIFGTISALCAVGFMAYMMFTAFSGDTEDYANGISPMKYLPVVGIMFLASAVYYLFFVRPKQLKAMKSDEPVLVGGTPDFTFKTQLFDKILKFASPGTQYVMHGHVSLGEFLESGMFRKENYKITGNDLVIGKHSGVPFQFCDLTASFQKTFHKENEAPDCALYGQFFVARFNKSFATPVYIVPRTSVKGFFLNNEIDSYTNTPGEKIELEDPEFMKMFKVFGADQIEARYILTPALMERIKNLALRTKGQYYISFFNNKITVANNSGKNNFEVSSFKSITKNDNQMLIDFYQDICDQFAIIDDLKLNIKIWK